MRDEGLDVVGVAVLYFHRVGGRGLAFHAHFLLAAEARERGREVFALASGDTEAVLAEAVVLEEALRKVHADLAVGGLPWDRHVLDAVLYTVSEGARTPRRLRVWT